MRPSPSEDQTQSVVFEAVPVAVVLALMTFEVVLAVVVLVSVLAVVVLALMTFEVVLVAEVLVLAVVVLMLVVNRVVQRPRLYSHLVAS